MTRQVAKASPQPDCTQTCWRGLCISHPCDWEAARLSEYQQPNQLSLVDRRYQRLEASWQILKRPPDLEAMYAKLEKTLRGKNSRRSTDYTDERNSTEGHSSKSVKSGSIREIRGKPLLGHLEWRGLVQQEATGQIVHAGRFFPTQSMLVEFVLVWPEERDNLLETFILNSVQPINDRPVLSWRALGLHVELEKEFELTEASSRVGRVCWTFERAKPYLSITIERLAMGKFWLKENLATWLAKERPREFGLIGLAADSMATEMRRGHGTRSLGGIEIAGHEGARVDSQRGGLVAKRAHRAIRRADWAWLCPEQERVYHVAAQWMAHREPNWPQGLLARCCRDVKIAP
jgi:hypothetical protein